MTTFEWAVDEHGPRLVVVLRLPADCTGYVVVDDVSLGPAIGGVRLGPSVTAAEVARLARAMTLKNAAALLPHGGGKAGIRTPGDLDAATRQQVIRAFAHGIRHLDEYIPGPDMGTDETAMAWIHDEIGRAVGLPAVLGGIPLDEIGATGYGLAACADALADAGRLTLSGARLAIQGFGAVGRHAAVFLPSAAPK
jgi:glutamate dehydrogenase (NAD(P)+)